MDSLDKLNPIPENTIIKEDALYQIFDLCEKLRLGKSVLLVYDETTKSIAGDSIQKQLEGNYNVYSFTITNADNKNVDNVTKYMQSKKADFAIGVGGGRPIDVAKVSSYNCNKPFISFITNTSHDGFPSERASIINSNNQKVSYQAHPPVAVVADIKILLGSPEKNTRAGIGDGVSNLTACADWKRANEMYGESINEEAYYHANLVSKQFLDFPEKFEIITADSMKIIIYELIRSGKSMQLAGSSRPASGWEHKISHALDKIAKIPDLHGKQCAHGTLISVLAYEAMGYPIEDYPLEKVIEAFDKLKLLQEPSVTAKETIEACRISNSINQDRYTIGNRLNSRIIEDIVRNAYKLYESR